MQQKSVQLQKQKSREGVLKPLSNKKVQTYEYIGFDVETYGKENNFYLAGFLYYEKDGREVYKVFYNQEDAINWMITSEQCKKKKIVATNLSFDITKLFWNTKYWNDLDLIYRGSDLITANIKHRDGRKVKFVDTINIAPFSVEIMGDVLGKEKLQKPRCWKRIETDIGFEYKIEKPKNQEEKKELEEYNKRDCKITADFIYFFQNFFNKVNGNLKPTIASTSFETWRRGFLKTTLVQERRVLQDESVHEFLLEAIKGGRTEIFKRGYFKNVFSADIVSLYPSVQRENKFPLPNSAREPKNKTKLNIFEYEGVSKVTIYCPKMKKPFLPKKVKRGQSEKLCFPVGMWTDTYTHVELRKAIELGYSIVSIHRQIIYTKTYDFFSEYIDYFFRLKDKYSKEKSPMKIPCKLALNSLWGKFGQKKVTKTEIKDIESFGNLKEYRNFFEENPKAELHDNVVSYSIEEEYKGNNSFPIIAAYVLAYARIKMYKYLQRDDVIYTDTDSIMTEKPINNTGTELGELEYEGEYKECWFLKPKMYMMKKEKETKVKVKGINKPNEFDFEKIKKGESVEKQKLSKLKESIRRGFTPYQQMKVDKHMKKFDDKRKWNGNESEPIKILYDEVLE